MVGAPPVLATSASNGLRTPDSNSAGIHKGKPGRICPTIEVKSTGKVLGVKRQAPDSSSKSNSKLSKKIPKKLPKASTSNSNKIKSMNKNKENVIKKNKEEKQRSRLKSSSYRGVSRCAKDGRWQARIRIGRTVKYLGRFKTEAAAAACYDKAAKEYHGLRAVLNFGDMTRNQSVSIGYKENQAKRARLVEKLNTNKNKSKSVKISAKVSTDQADKSKNANNENMATPTTEGSSINNMMKQQGNIFRTGSALSLLSLPSIAHPLNLYSNCSAEDLKKLMAQSAAMMTPGSLMSLNLSNLQGKHQTHSQHQINPFALLTPPAPNTPLSLQAQLAWPQFSQLASMVPSTPTAPSSDLSAADGLMSLNWK